MRVTTCPKHKTKMRLILVTTGGCHGHFGEDDNCYCDALDVHAELFCPGTPGKPCRQQLAVVPGLTDLQAIERWIRERL